MKRRQLREIVIVLAEHGKYPRAYLKKKRGVFTMKKSKFAKLVGTLERKGKGMGKAKAEDIAGAIGEKKYGKKGMAKKAALGRKKAEAK